MTLKEPAGRRSALYEKSLSVRAREIADVLTTVHKSFNSPQSDGVDVQLQDLGASALTAAYEGLEGAYSRHLQRLGIQLVHASGLDQTCMLAVVTVANLPRRYLWKLRNAPSKHPHQPDASVLMQVSISNSGTIGALQTVTGSTAHVPQQSVIGDVSELQAALAALVDALEHTQDFEPDVRRELVADVDRAATALQQENLNKGSLLRWLGGIGAAGSVQPAYDAVEALARAPGLPL